MYDLSRLGSCGEDVYISENVEIKRPYLVNIGSHIAIDSYFYCTANLRTGDYVHIASMVSIIGGVNASLFIGNFCTIAAGCRILCASDNFSGDGLVTAPGIPKEFLNGISFMPIFMGDYSSLASNVVVTSGVKIGQGAVIGANSYVNRDVPPWETWAGSPIRCLKYRPSKKMIDFGEKLKNG